MKGLRKQKNTLNIKFKALPKAEPAKRRTEFIKRDDPRFKKRGDY